MGTFRVCAGQETATWITDVVLLLHEHAQAWVWRWELIRVSRFLTKKKNNRWSSHHMRASVWPKRLLRQDFSWYCAGVNTGVMQDILYVDSYHHNWLNKTKFTNIYKKNWQKMITSPSGRIPISHPVFPGHYIPLIHCHRDWDHAVHAADKKTKQSKKKADISVEGGRQVMSSLGMSLCVNVFTGLCVERPFYLHWYPLSLSTWDTLVPDHRCVIDLAEVVRVETHMGLCSAFVFARVCVLCVCAPVNNYIVFYQLQSLTSDLL